MENLNCFSKLGTIKLSDWWRGLIVAIATAPLSIIYESVSAGQLTFNWKVIVTTALAAGIAYIIKNISTGQGGRLLTNASPTIKLLDTKR
jgi:hypothetical protein